MANKRSAAAKKRRKELVEFIRSFKPMSLQTLSWFKLCSIDPTSLPHPLMVFYSNMSEHSAFLSSSSGINGHDLSVPFHTTPNRPTIRRVYKDLKNSRLARLGTDLLEMVFNFIDPKEAGGSGVLAQYALTKAVFPLLEHVWDAYGNENLNVAIRAVLKSASLIRLPQFETPLTSYATFTGYHQCWSLSGSDIIEKTSPSLHQNMNNPRGDHHLPLDWKSSLRTQLQALFFSHLRTVHCGISPELALSCIIGTANSPPCRLANHYKQHFLFTRGQHIAINIESDSLEDIVGAEYYPGQTIKRIILSVNEVDKLQRLIVLKNFTSGRGLKALEGMCKRDGRGRYETTLSLDDLMEDIDASWILQHLFTPFRYPDGV